METDIFERDPEATCAALGPLLLDGRRERIDEVIADPQVAARGMMVEQDHPTLGKVRLPNLPFRFSDCDTSPRSVAPMLGQHNREVASRLGYTPAEIDALIADGVLYAEPAVESPQPA